MKKLIAIAAILSSTQAFAFFDEGNTNGAFVQNGKGNATGKGEATFGMTFEGAGKTNGLMSGNGSNNGNTVFRGDDARDNASATGFADNNGSARGDAMGEGTAKFSFNFSARAEGNGDMNSQTSFASENAPYYYGK